MSCFGGLMTKYKYLSIDRFDGQNLSSYAFFLSHCHTDHMVGLSNSKFLSRLESGKNIHLYSSEVTKSLLLADKQFEHLKKYIVELPIENPTVINISHKDEKSTTVAVTLISAGHCPGSVMFFFEGDEGNVLYTGDFRLPKGSAKRIRPLHMFDKTKKKMNSMHVDTTFCSENSVFIPKREDCVASLITLVKEWLAKDDNNAVKMRLSAKYGYEFLFHALNKALNCKIYCRRRNVYYCCLRQIYDILTEKPEWTKIFACLKTDKVEVEDKRLNFLNITLSTLYFTAKALPTQLYEKISENNYRFCFSFHSSYSEVCDFVKYFSPDNVYANVIPFGETSLEVASNNLAAKCGLKPLAVTCLPEKTAAVDPATCFVNSEQTDVSSPTHPIKRAISLSPGEDSSTQDCWERIVEKARKRDAGITQEHSCKSKSLCTADPTRSEFNVPCSPNEKEPTQSKVDSIHVKLALGDIFS